MANRRNIFGEAAKLLMIIIGRCSSCYLFCGAGKDIFYRFMRFLFKGNREKRELLMFEYKNICRERPTNIPYTWIKVLWSPVDETSNGNLINTS